MPQRNLFFFDSFGVAAGIPENLVGIPFILDDEGNPASEINQYLYHRAVGNWAPEVRKSSRNARLEGKEVNRPSTVFMKNRAYQLNAHRRWMIERNITIQSHSQDDLFDYHSDLMKIVGASSANQYILGVVDFLEFCISAGYRTALHIARKPSPKRTRSRGAPVAAGRRNPKEITRWYSEDQIFAFISEFEDPSAIIAAKVMYGVGARLSEAISLQESTFPTVAEVTLTRSVPKLKIVGKGGKTRFVPIPLWLLQDVDNYRNIDRAIALRGININPAHLILGFGEKASPVNARTLQKKFAINCASSGRAGITPHILRHHFAVHYLLRKWRDHPARHEHWTSREGELYLSAPLALLQEYLGHAHIDTTFRYVQGLSTLWLADYSNEYSEALHADR
ncbi:tyrosine-type recombinase/integrase [Cereibacter sp. SYSU M97828]|nr:tyrosine-type recombinase/integrase [Cereibacter flavus]